MDGPTLKRKVTVKLTYNTPSTSRPSSRTNLSRPPSPTKFFEPSESSVAFRPKAKVNSSALRKTASTISSANVTPRAGSPTKFTRSPNGTRSSTFQPKVQPTVKPTMRPQTPVSAPGTLDARSRRLATASEVGKSVGTRNRDGSVSLHHAMSFSSLQSSNQETTSVPPMRVRSKVSGITKITNENASPSLNLPSQPSTRSTNPRTRAPSISSNVSQSPDPIPQFYPITTATPAANPHRFVTMRGSPPLTHHQYQPFIQTVNDPNSGRPKTNGVVRADPASIPLHSPPTSAVSFSSRSSASHSSVSYTESSAMGRGEFLKLVDGGTAEQLKSTLDNLLKYTSSTSDERNDSSDGGKGNDLDVDVDADHQERKVRAEAKSNRKIADLEITNRSLLTINASLEAVKHRQAKEIRELRRKLRESRLILPPRTYQAVKSSLDPEEEGEGEEGAEDSETEDLDDGGGDESYQRIKAIIDNLLSAGKRALEKNINEFSLGGKGVAKVLSPEEQKFWQSSNIDISDHNGQLNHEPEAEHKESPSHPNLPLITHDDEYSDNDSDDEPPPSGHDTILHTQPPIRITESL